MKSKVIGLDISSTRTGVARADGSTESIKLTDADPYARLHQLHNALFAILKEDRPDAAIIEEPIVVRGLATARRLHEFVGHARWLCFAFGVPVVELKPSTLKKWATGNGAATKDDMHDEAARRGATPANDDEADAFLLREWAIAYTDDPARIDSAVARWLAGAKS